MSKTSASALCAGLALAAALASAASAESISVNVRTADLNLNTKTGVHVLAQRIRAAAVRACYADDHLYDATGYVDCINEAAAKATASVRGSSAMLLARAR
jgi:UrcA family protein